VYAERFPAIKPMSLPSGEDVPWEFSMIYAQAVRLGKEAAKSQWVLGDLALDVGTEYGEGKLQQYADDIGVEYEALKTYRTVARAYESGIRSPDSTWSIHRLFAAQHDRAALVRKRWTAAKARKEVRDRAERDKRDERTFSTYYSQIVDLAAMISGFNWNQPERDKMAVLFEQVAKELREARAERNAE